MNTHEPQGPQLAVIRSSAPDSAALRETAFEQWALVHRKNARKVAHALGLPERTVQDWVTRNGWEDERTRRLAELVPNLAAGVIEDVVYALVNSAKYARLASEPPTDDDGIPCTQVIVDQAGKTHYLGGPTRDRTQLAELSLKLADALAGDQGLAGLLAGLRGERGATPLAGVGAASDDDLTDELIDAMSEEERGRG